MLQNLLALLPIFILDPTCTCGRLRSKQESSNYQLLFVLEMVLFFNYSFTAASIPRVFQTEAGKQDD